MSFQFIRYFVYIRGLKNFKNCNILDVWKSLVVVIVVGIVYKFMMCVLCGVKYIVLGGDFGLKFCFQFGLYYIYNMCCNRKDCEF